MLPMTDDDLKRIFTIDETLIDAYYPETAQQSSVYRAADERKPNKPRQSKSKIKVLLSVFFDYRGVVYKEFLPTDQTVNKEYYLGLLHRLRESIRKK